ncbi:MAG: translation initiation factor IF-3, partial [Lactobacillus crispatus]|nr:translation initiation factor IF-3 [Lactobacillus crispatus]
IILNEEIRAREVRLIGEDGEQIGVVTKSEALQRATEADLDLVLISPNAKPPVARIMNYGKYRFEQQKKEKENRKNQKVTAVKEIRLSPTIEGNDFDTKLKHVRNFLAKGAKVRVSIRFRGRAITHNELGKEVLEKMAEQAKDLSSVTASPTMEGRSMFLILSPLSDKDKKKK